MSKKSNIGQVGPESIRLNGALISELPIAERVNASQQIPLAYDDERKNKIESILNSYPKQDLSYISGVIREAKSNIERITKLRSEQFQMINDYKNIVSMCRIRDKELSLYPDEPERSEKIREWNVTLAGANTAAYIVYEDTEPFQKQIEQCEETIQKADDVLEKERDDIASYERLSGQIIARDMELKKLGVIKKK